MRLRRAPVEWGQPGVHVHVCDHEGGWLCHTSSVPGDYLPVAFVNFPFRLSLTCALLYQACLSCHMG